ncbi:ef-hand calcium-binding domain-containing protein 6-like [Stylonychia lemnae]|uniref:Ef-hand calcium-binding domain-containing protein 6-like n=1 Tax=Stylonychia lemnae TaxID=5949 RepID=A0A077ZPN0_STYLE|nr:ef-hand calcium-binding domain-containing protein 6-like [Stylonychia lemnae]|eukprot:CDW71853.1 ef-hand calcium-binding domain-containing protein 6-like [Stylonychia lemnae]
MDFETFKKSYFPQLFHVKDDNQSEDEHDDLQKLKQGVSQNTDQEQSLFNKLTKLETMIKDKFANNWVSVRKAFLDLDTDYDGFVTVEDILRYFGNEGTKKEFDFRDLKKLIVDKDSKRLGKISYADFSKWMGGVIHQSEGFYFRHDSMKNPQYEKNLKNYEEKIMRNNQKIMKEQLDEMDIEHTVIEKIKFQWKTLKKAFIDLNQEKTGAIKPAELKIYLHHWGLYINDEQFKKLFDKFDHDKDGKISYEDFQNTVGMEINPMEFLYFRQDNPRAPKQQTCRHDKCWESPIGFSDYCQTHVKMFKERGLQILTGLTEKIPDWKTFIKRIRQNVQKDDANIIKFTTFIKVLEDYDVKLNEREKELIMQSFVANQDRDNILINVSRLFSIRLTNKIRKIYDKVDMYEEMDNPDLVDNSGYFGIFYREKVNLKDINENQFVDVISRNNKLVGIMKNIKEIDKDNNGYVTNQELDDIFKMHYERELGDKDIKKLFKPFASIQNRILIDYKKLRDHILAKLKDRDDKGEQVLPTQITLDKRSESFKSSLGRSIMKQRLSTERKPILRIEDQSANYIQRERPNKNTLNNIDYASNPTLKTPEKYGKNINGSLFQNNSQIMGFTPMIKDRIKTPSLMQKNQNMSANFKNHQNLNKSLINDPTQITSSLTKNAQVRTKLAYEWKNIYRGLSLQDQQNSGKINKRLFEKTVHQNGVYLSKEELINIYSRFSISENDIDYAQMSKDMGLQSNSLNLVSQTHKYLSQIHQYGQNIQNQHSQMRPQSTNTQISNLKSVQDTKSVLNFNTKPQYLNNSNTHIEETKSVSRSVINNDVHQRRHSQQSQRSYRTNSVMGNDSRNITKILNKNLDQIKYMLKSSDVNRKGYLSEQQMMNLMKNFNIALTSYGKFKKTGTDEVDYIKFLKHYL